MNVTEYLSQLTLEEKAALCAGADFWHTAAIKRLSIPSVMMSDGPHGLRRQKGRKAIGKSHPATCFPTAVTSGCSFDRELLTLEGAAIAREAKAQGVGLVLGPGLNIKRHPLCGRNFEYFSEDPCLSGELAAAFVNGIQSQGVGACLKHFACNSQEAGRMISDSVADERALREIYLAGFETAVKKSAPMAVMGAYNKINGTYACEHKPLLTDILRADWGFSGMVVTDWGAMNDVTASIPAGLDLEMPASGGHRTKQLIEAIARGEVPMEALDRAAANVLRLVMAVKDNRPEPFDKREHHALARRIARESAVLLQNNGLLPLDPKTKVSLIMGSVLRCQGEGSSLVNAADFTPLESALEERGIVFLSAGSGNPDRVTVTAKAGDAVILLAGIPGADESEAMDRPHLSLPEEQNRLIETVLEANPNTVVVLTGGGAMDIPWADKAGAILYMGLGGQAVGGAVTDLLFGDENPSGRLAETWPISLSDCPAAPWFGDRDTVEYRESVFVGYRYYNTANRPVRYPFGHGLSYTSFSYSDLLIDEETMTVAVTVQNTGSRFGKEVVQLYIAPPDGPVFRPAQELRDFTKIYLAPGEKKTLYFPLPERHFSLWNTKTHAWCVPGGTYTVQIGTSSRDIRAEGQIHLDRPSPETEHNKDLVPAYYAPQQGEKLSVPREQFETLVGRPIHRKKSSTLTLNSTLADTQDLPIGRFILKLARRLMGGESAMVTASLDQTPFRSFYMKGVSLPMAERLLRYMNRRRKKINPIK